MQCSICHSGTFDRDTAFFIGGSAERERAVLLSLERADRQFVAFLTVHRHQDLVDEGRNLFLHFAAAGAGTFWPVGLLSAAVFQLAGTADLDRLLHALLNRGIVHFDDLAAFVAIGVDYRVASVFLGFFQRNDLRQFEKRRLHHHVDPAAQPMSWASCTALIV
jgi:hypothetical protein